MVSCDICGKEFKNTQGLRGHKNFVHSDNGSGIGQSVAQQAAQQPLSSNLGTRVTTEQRLSQLENRFARLEHVTGVRETDELEKLLGFTDTPLTEQVNQLSKQLSKLTEQLKSEYVSRETMETIVAELTGESDSLHKEIVNTYNLLVSTIHEDRESRQNSVSKIEGQFTPITNQLYELLKSVKYIQESAQANSDSINQLNTKLVALEHKSTELKNKVDGVKNLARRVPTGKIVGAQLKDKREHHFREYKSSEGLAQPYRTARDLILGDRWIDLAEPED